MTDMVAPYSVLVCGGQIGRFGRWNNLSLLDLVKPVLTGSLASAGIKLADIGAAFVGNSFGGMLQNQETILGQVLFSTLGFASLRVHNVKNACSSGSDAVHLGWSSVAYGQYDCVLVVGVEKMTHPDHRGTMAALASASDRQPTSPNRSVFMDLNSERALRYMRVYGATPRHYAMCAVKNRAHALLNEKAAIRSAITVEDVLADRVVLNPLTRAMCGGIADGAASLFLVSEKFARRHSLSGPRIIASSVEGGCSDRQDGPSVTARSAKAAYEYAGVGPVDISLAEVHDPTSPQELFDIEDIGLCAPGGSIALLERQATSLGGAIPVNVSGGLTARGHPVGATGVAQIIEIAEQLEGRAGKRQVDGARIGIAQMAGGLVGADSAVATVHILSV
ncbi:MAG: thiolase family protein [Burkholderiaceae bacterium]|nr:MAG: thiolase family protein [Burkholderiaceae bacterium]